MSKIGILHPGEMGISIAVSALNNGHQVYWLSQGRSDTTRARAEKHSLIETKSLSEFGQTCEVIISICPPHAAEEVAQSVIETKFSRLYLDANAISPQRAFKIGKMMEANKIQFAWQAMRHGDVWVISCWREHRKCLNVNIRNVLLACEGVRTDCVRKSMNYQISILTGFFCLMPDLGPNLNRMVHQLLEQLDKVVPGII